MVPVVRQRSGFDCGAAAFESVCRYWETRTRLPHGWPNPIDGTDPRVLEAAFRTAGFGVVAGEMDTGTLRHLTGRGLPVLCLVRDGSGHWVVATKVTRTRVYFMDPERGDTHLPLGRFDSLWSAADTDRTGTVYHRWGICAHG